MRDNGTQRKITSSLVDEGGLAEKRKDLPVTACSETERQIKSIKRHFNNQSMLVGSPKPTRRRRVTASRSRL